MFISEVADFSPIVQELLVELFEDLELDSHLLGRRPFGSAGDNAVASRPHRGRRMLGAVISPPEYHSSQDSTETWLRSDKDDNAPLPVLLWHRQGVIIEQL